ncbi:hypothetical protein LCGC14_1780590 [marine sediment metagenome]|uniref:Uncharacterized protein n=1 Tax=marine sediment metagenome TaxID=412755 RepID=A0A0F9JAH9_9ZZZZ
MPNGFNPLTAPLTMLKQIGEQASVTIQGLGTGMATATSQGLDALISGVPPLPGVPGVAARPGIPTPAQLMPANLQQALGQVENLLIPPGLPRPSQVLRTVPTTPTPPTPPTPATPPAVAQRRRVAERRGM